jgi:hypothetical protein
LQARFIVVAELLLRCLKLGIRLPLEETHELLLPLLIFISLLMFSHLELFVPHAPKLRKVLLLLYRVGFLVLLLLNLKSTASLDSLLHLKLAPLLVLEKAVSLVFGLSNLLVENLFLVIFESAQLFNLMVDHALPGSKFVLEPSILAILSLIVKHLFGVSELLNAFFLIELVLSHELLLSNLVTVSLRNVLLYALHFLLALNLSDLLALEVLFSLPLDELALKHLFFEPLNIVKFELIKLVADRL